MVVYILLFQNLASEKCRGAYRHIFRSQNSTSISNDTLARDITILNIYSWARFFSLLIHISSMSQNTGLCTYRAILDDCSNNRSPRVYDLCIWTLTSIDIRVMDKNIFSHRHCRDLCFPMDNRPPTHRTLFYLLLSVCMKYYSMFDVTIRYC